MAKTYTREEFVKEYEPYINSVTKGTGILAGTLISQAIIESQGKGSDGNYYVGASKLAREANNYFGIKASKGWTGGVYNIDTGEYTSSGTKYTEKGAGFRKYNSVKDSIADYVKFLQSNPRYKEAGVFNAKTVEQQAKALQKAGYATNPDYSSMINKIYDGVKGFATSTYEKVKGQDTKTLVIFGALSLISISLGVYYIYKKKK
jgi:flagellum-specific peptidoglycan hydrolase FlgJ